MPESYSEKIIYLNSESGTEQYQNTSGWYLRNNNSIRKKKEETTIDVERNKTLRVKDSTIKLPGVIRFNNTLERFQGYTGNLINGNEGWTDFQTFVGIDGENGSNSISEMVGLNVSNDANSFGIFKDIVTETLTTSTTAEIVVDNQFENILTAPSFAYTDFNYGSTSQLMDLSGKTLTFQPYQNTSYRLFVRNNDIYPPVKYQSHSIVRELNLAKIDRDNHFKYYLQGKQFKFYNTLFEYVYIHENGYLNLVGGDSFLLTGNYANHFADFRISAFLNNLVNNGTDEDTNRPDIFVGTGPYGEIVITYNNFSAIEIDPNNSSNTIQNNFNNFQIRLFTNNVNSSYAKYSDDNYPPGTIQISYGKSSHQSPLVGLSNNVPYSETTYTPTPFSNFLDTDYTETTGLGVPKLDATFVLEIEDGEQAAILANNTLFQDDGQLVNSGNKYKLIVKNSNWTTSYSERYNGVYYYTRIIDMGPISGISKFYVAIQGLHDTDLSDINNRTTSGANIDLSDWANLDNFIDISSIYTATYTKDYQNVYEATGFNIPNFNSYLHSIQVRYSDRNQESTSGSGSTTFYDGTLQKRLLFKVVYRLDSDIERPNGNTSFLNATKITLPTNISTTPVTFTDNGNTEFHFIPGSDDYFEFTIDTSKSYTIELFDNSPDSASRNNYGLGMTIYKKATDNTDPILVKGKTEVNLNVENNLNTYPGNTIDNQYTVSSDLSRQTFYIQITGDKKSYYYGVKIAQSTTVSLSTNIFAFTIPNVNYNSLSSGEREALKIKIKNMLADGDTGDSIIFSSISNVILERVEASDGSKSILATAVLGSIALGELEALVATFNLTPPSLVFDVTEVEITREIINPTANTTSIANLPTDTIPSDDDDTEPPEPPSSVDYTTDNFLTLKKANYLSSNANIHLPYEGTDYFDRYYHTSVKQGNKIFYCYLSIDMTATGSAFGLNLNVFYKSPNNLFAVDEVATITYNQISDIMNYPFNIFNVDNKVVVLYTTGVVGAQSFNMKQYTVAESLGSVNISFDEVSYTMNDKQKSFFKNNVGVVDNGNIYTLEVSDANKITVVKFNSNLERTALKSFTESEINYADEDYVRLYNGQDRFSTTDYLYLLVKKSSSNYQVRRIHKTETETPQFYMYNQYFYIVQQLDGSINFKTQDSSMVFSINTAQTNNLLTEVVDFMKTIDNNDLYFLNKTGKMIRVRNSNPRNTVFDNVYSMHRNAGAEAIKFKEDGDMKIKTLGDPNYGGDGKQRNADNGQAVSGFDANNETNIDNIFSNEVAFAALKTDGSIITWGRYSANQSDGIESYDSGGRIDIDQSGKTFVNIYNTQNSFGALTDDGKFYTWGNLYQAYMGNSGLGADTTVIENVYDVKTTQFAYAVLVPDSSGNENSYKVISFGGKGEDYTSGGYALSTTFSSGNQNYGEFMQYFDFATSSYKTITSGENQGITALYSNTYAFAAYNATAQSVITWGFSDMVSNSGGSPYTYNYQTSQNVSVKTKLASGVLAITHNAASFLAIKETEIVVWGQKDTGGSAYVIDFSTIPNYNAIDITNSDNFGSLTINDVYATNNAYAIKKGNTVRFLGSSDDGAEIDAINDILEVQTYYRPSILYLTMETGITTFVLIKTDLTVTATNAFEDVFNNIDGMSGKSLSLEPNFNPVNNANSSLINQNLKNYDYVTSNVNQRNTIVFGALDSDYYYLKLDTNFKLFRNRNITSLVDFTATSSSSIIRQFELFTTDSKYLLLVYLDTSVDPAVNKLEVVRLTDQLNTLTRLTHSITNLDGAKIISNLLYIYYYETTEPKKIRLEVYTLGETSITGPDTFHEIYNVEEGAPESSIIMPDNYPMEEIFANPLTVDNVSGKNSFYMVGRSTDDVPVNTNKYNYFLIQYDLGYNTTDRSLDIDNSTPNEILVSQSNTESEQVDRGEDDNIDIKETIMDSVIDRDNVEVKMLNGNHICAGYVANNRVNIKIYNDYEFVDYEIERDLNSLESLKIECNNRNINLFYEDNEILYYYKFKFEEEIELVYDNQYLLPVDTSMSYTEDDIGNNYIGYYEEGLENLTFKIEKFDKEGNRDELIQFDVDNLTTIKFHDSKLWILGDNNNYYIYNLESEELDEKYLLTPLTYSDVIIQEDLYYFGIEGGQLNLFQNFDSILNLGNLDIKIERFELVNNKYICVVYQNKNLENSNKNIIFYDISNQTFKSLVVRFDMLVLYPEVIVLVDSRRYNNQLTFRYVNYELEVLNLNIFEDSSYNYTKLFPLSLQGDVFSFGALKLDEDDIEESYLVNRLEYQNNSQGLYSTLQYPINYNQPEVEDGEGENEFVEETYNLTSFNQLALNRSGSNNLVLELVAEVGIDTTKKYLFEHKQESGTGIGSFDSNNDYRLKEGTYILKNIPYEYPIAILVKTATGDKNMITYRGLSYNNINPTNVGSSLVKQVTEDSETHFYYFYYGDVEVKVLGDFGEVSFYSFNDGYMGGEKSFVYDTSITRNTEIESNKLYERDGLNRITVAPYYGADPMNSSFVVGRSKDTVEEGDDLDAGTNLYSYMKAYYDNLNETCFYIRSNGIPSYQPSRGNVIYKGSWQNENSNITDNSKNFYSIYYQSRGWFDRNNILQGDMIKIPLEPKIATKNNYTSAVNFQENFWYQDDLYWKTLMTQTEYDEKLLTPMGPIAVALNGVSIYNFSIMANTVTETYSSNSFQSGNFDYQTTSNLVTTLSTNNSKVVVNGVEDSITNTQVFDNQGGTVDLNYHYHYHYYPITLEGQIYFSTFANRDPNNSFLFDVTKIVPKEGFKMYIGHTYYLNVNHPSNRTSDNQNLFLGFALGNSENVYSEEYNFENTLIRNGDTGVGIGSYIKFKVPDTFTTSNTLQLVRVSRNTETTSINADYGGYYHDTTVSNTTPHLTCGYREVGLILNVSDSKYQMSDSNGNLYDENNKLYFEKDVSYNITLEESYKSSGLKLGFKRVDGADTVIYNPEVLTYDTDTISLRFSEEVSGLFFYDVENNTSNVGNNYLSISVFEPESIHYYTRVETNQFIFYNDNDLSNFTFNGQLEWEDAYSYLVNKKTFTGPTGHSPLLGYAFDGFPIYGPLGYDKGSAEYYDNDDSNIPVKFLKSSYSDSITDNNGNPTYNPNIGDLDFCNGIFSKTPEFPQGVYHYICTIDLDDTGNPVLQEDSTYKFRNVSKKIIKPAYPYVIGAFKGIPELSNFPWASTQGAISNTNIEKKKFTFNFKSLRSEDVSLNGKTNKSISITQDPNNLNLLVNPQSYKWNFSNTQQTSIFGRDDLSFGNKISDLRSSETDTVFKAYGKVSKWISSGAIEKGSCVTIVNKIINEELYLCVKKYSETGLSEQEENVDLLGIALNDTTGDGEEVYVCQEGITTVKINNAVSVKCSSYGIISVLSENTGRVVGLDAGTNILSNTPVVGTFLENKTTVQGDYVLFKVKTNYEFN